MSDGSSWRDRVLGTRDRLGWWTLPLFAAVGLTGAVLAGSLAVVYYGQQVSGLEEETQEGRAELRGAVEDVEAAGQEALDAIEQEVEEVRESLTRELPFEDVTTSGVVALRVVTGAGPPPAPEAQASPSPPGTGTPEERVGTGFAVASDGGATFIATTYALVQDAGSAAEVVAEVEVVTPRGSVVGAVHSWDAGRDLALIRADVGQVELLPWRPSAEELAGGERVVAAGVTPTLDTVQLSGQVAYNDVTVLVTDLPVVGFLRGAPIVDGDGRVVGIVSDAYQPFGSGAGERQGMIPAQLLCERMLRNCAALEAPAEG